MPVLKLIAQYFSCLTFLCLTLVACTPAFTEHNGKKLVAQTRITDSVDIQRGNQRLLSHQAQLCLVSDSSGSEAGLTVLRTMQMALSGYFVAVGVENEPMDYLRALSITVCPTSTYLFYVQPIASTGCAAASDNCSDAGYSQFIITIVNSGDRSLLDRVRLSLKNGILPLDKNNQQRLQRAFEQLAIELSGSGS